MEAAKFSFPIDHNRIGEMFAAIRLGTPLTIDPQTDAANLLAVALGLFWQDAGTIMDMSGAEVPSEVKALLEHWNVADDATPPHVRQISAADREAVSKLLQIVGWRAMIIDHFNDGAQLRLVEQQIESVTHLLQTLDPQDPLYAEGQAFQKTLAESREAQLALQPVGETAFRDSLKLQIEHQLDAPGLCSRQQVRVLQSNGKFNVEPIDG